jgi:hypothetical protein
MNGAPGWIPGFNDKTRRKQDVFFPTDCMMRLCDESGARRIEEALRNLR